MTLVMRYWLSTYQTPGQRFPALAWPLTMAEPPEWLLPASGSSIGKCWAGTGSHTVHCHQNGCIRSQGHTCPESHTACVCTTVHQYASGLHFIFSESGANYP